MYDQSSTELPEHNSQIPWRPAVLSAHPPPKPVSRPWGFMDVLLVGGSAGIVILVVGLIGTWFWEWLLNVEANPGDELVVSVLSGVMIFTAVFLNTLLVLRLRKRSLSQVGYRPPSRWWLLAGVILGVLFIPIRVSIVLILMVVLTPGDIFASDEEMLWQNGDPSLIGILLVLVGGFVLVVILAPLAEELLFRGVLYPWLRRRFGKVIAIGGSGVLFGLAHIEPMIVVSNSILGMVLAVSYEYSRSLWIPTLIHFVNNLLVAIMLGGLIVIVLLGGGA